MAREINSPSEEQDSFFLTKSGALKEAKSCLPTEQDLTPPQVNAVIEELQRLQLSQDNARQPHTRIRDGADTVPAFDGRNITIHQFTKCCRIAKNMIAPNAEYGLVQLIKSKLSGQASRVILNGDYNTIEEVIKVLSSRFAPLHSPI